MKTINKITRKMCCAVAVMFLALAASSYAGPSTFTLNSRITTQAQVSALKPGEQVAMVCAKCKTVQIAKADQAKGILGWFQPKTKHLCPGCGGKMEMVTGAAPAFPNPTTCNGLAVPTS